MENETCYIEFLNKDKNFTPDKKVFTGPNAYTKTVKWAQKNLEKFDPDMIKYKR